MFEQLNKAIIAEADQQKAESRFFIENGYCESGAEEHRTHSDEGIRRYCTAHRWEQYHAKEISREKIVELTVARMEKQKDKETAERLAKLERVAAAPDLHSVSIFVEWKRNPTWGYNPTATVTVHTGNGWEQYTGTASGCGYDKRTAAIGAALNQSEAVLKMLYATKEAKLSNPPEKGRQLNPFAPEDMAIYEENTSNNTLIHYGAGYGVLPYFEGGVGMSSFHGVFEACGFKCTADTGTKTSDFYHFERKEVAAHG